MKERYYSDDSKTEEILREIVESRLGRDPLRDFKMRFLFAKDALVLTSRELIQIIDLYESQSRNIKLAAEESAIKKYLNLMNRKVLRLPKITYHIRMKNCLPKRDG